MLKELENWIFSVPWKKGRKEEKRGFESEEQNSGLSSF